MRQLRLYLPRHSCDDNLDRTQCLQEICGRDFRQHLIAAFDSLPFSRSFCDASLDLTRCCSQSLRATSCMRLFAAIATRFLRKGRRTIHSTTKRLVAVRASHLTGCLVLDMKRFKICARVNAPFIPKTNSPVSIGKTRGFVVSTLTS